MNRTATHLPLTGDDLPSLRPGDRILVDTHVFGTVTDVAKEFLLFEEADGALGMVIREEFAERSLALRVPVLPGVPVSKTEAARELEGSDAHRIAAGRLHRMWWSAQHEGAGAELTPLAGMVLSVLAQVLGDGRTRAAWEAAALVADRWVMRYAEGEEREAMLRALMVAQEEREPGAEETDVWLVFDDSGLVGCVDSPTSSYASFLAGRKFGPEHVKALRRLRAEERVLFSS